MYGIALDKVNKACYWKNQFLVIVGDIVARYIFDPYDIKSRHLYMPPVHLEDYFVSLSIKKTYKSKFLGIHIWGNTST